MVCSRFSQDASPQPPSARQAAHPEPPAFSLGGAGAALAMPVNRGLALSMSRAASGPKVGGWWLPDQNAKVSHRRMPMECSPARPLARSGNPQSRPANRGNAWNMVSCNRMVGDRMERSEGPRS